MSTITIERVNRDAAVEVRGAVAIVRAIRRGIAYFVLAESPVIATGEAQLAFPRRDILAPNGAAQFLADMSESAGIAANGNLQPVNLGQVSTNTATSASVVDVLLVTSGAADVVDGFVERDSGNQLVWFSRGELESAIASQEIRCGVTLAAWALLTSSAHARHPDEEWV